MPFADLRGQRFYYEDTGGSGTPLVFSHGILMDHSMFDPQVEAFGGDHRVITWDWRGFGDTEVDGSNYSIWDQVDDLVALLDHLGVEKAVFAGNSHGGYITMRMPLVRPDRVLGIITLNTNAAGLPEDQQPAYRQMFDAWISQGATDELCAAFAGATIGVPDVSAEWTARWQKRTDWNSMSVSIDITLGVEDIRSELAAVTAPAVVIHGIDDLAFNTTQAGWIAEAIPNAVGPFFVPGAHNAVLTHPKAVNLVIRGFLAEIE